MTDIATLGLAVDATQVKTATKALDDLVAAAKPAQQSAEDLAKSIKPTSAAAAEWTKITSVLTTGVESNTISVASATKAHSGLSSQAMAAQHSIRSLAEAMASGQPISMALGQQLNHLAYAATGPGGITGAFSAAAGSLLGLTTPGAAVVGTVAAIGVAAVVSANSWAAAQKQVELGIMGIGRASGATVGDINKIADATSTWKGLSVSEARQVATAFASTGKIGVDNIKTLTEQTRNFAALTGTDVPKAAEALASIFASPGKGAEQLAARIGGIDAATVKYVKTLEDQGNRQQAIKVLADAMAPALAGAADKAGTLAKSWNAVSNAFSNGSNSIGKALAGTADQQSQDQLEQRRAELEKLIASTKELAQTDTGSQRMFDTSALKNYTTELGNVNAALDRIKQAKAAAPIIDAMAFTNQIAPIVSSLAPAADTIRVLTTNVGAFDRVLSDPALENFRKEMGDQLPLAAARAKAALNAVTVNADLADPIKSQIDSLTLQNKLLYDQSPAMRARVAYQLAYNDAIKTGTDAEARQIASMRAAQASGGPMTTIQQQMTAIVAPHGRTLSAKEAKAMKSPQTTVHQENAPNDCNQHLRAA